MTETSRSLLFILLSSLSLNLFSVSSSDSRLGANGAREKKKERNSFFVRRANFQQIENVLAACTGFVRNIYFVTFQLLSLSCHFPFLSSACIRRLMTFPSVGQRKLNCFHWKQLINGVRVHGEAFGCDNTRIVTLARCRCPRFSLRHSANVNIPMTLRASVFILLVHFFLGQLIQSVPKSVFFIREIAILA